jgi:hypothetical protein
VLVISIIFEMVMFDSLKVNAVTLTALFSRSRTIFRSSDSAVIRVGHLVSFTL